MHLNIILDEKDLTCEWYQDSFGMIHSKQDKAKENFCKLVGESRTAVNSDDLKKFTLAGVSIQDVRYANNEEGKLIVDLDVEGCFKDD